MAAQVDSDGGNGRGLEKRVIRLEVFAEDARARLTRIEKRLDEFTERFIRIEARLDSLSEKMDTFVTKDVLAASLSELEARLLKWFVVTIFATASLAFTAAKLVH